MKKIIIVLILNVLLYGDQCYQIPQIFATDMTNIMKRVCKNEYNVNINYKKTYEFFEILTVKMDQYRIRTECIQFCDEQGNNKSCADQFAQNMMKAETIRSIEGNVCQDRLWIYYEMWGIGPR